MTALIVDDEQLGREFLRRLLETQGVQVAGEAEEASQILMLTQQLKPDVVFLDVRMPGMDGLEAARQLAKLETPPCVILVTGYSEYALDAFEGAALDYLVKPVSAERLKLTLQRVKRHVSLQAKARRLDSLRRANRAGTPARLAIRSRGAIKLVPFEKIYYVTTWEKAVVVKTRDGDVRATYTMAELEVLLPDGFMRVHASCIVNLAAIEEILIYGNHTYGIKLVNGDEVPLRRHLCGQLQERLSLGPISEE